MDELLKLNPLIPVKHSLYVIAKGQCENILINFLFYLQVNGSGVVLRAHSIVLILFLWLKISEQQPSMAKPLQHCSDPL